MAEVQLVPALDLPAFDAYPAIVRQGRQALYRKVRVVYDPERQRVRVWDAAGGKTKLAEDYAVVEGAATSTSSWYLKIGAPLNLGWMVYATGKPCNCGGARQLQQIDPWADPA